MYHPINYLNEKSNFDAQYFHNNNNDENSITGVKWDTEARYKYTSPFF